MNKLYEMMLCGDDGLFKMWDVCVYEWLLKVVVGYEYWIWNCAYNFVYDVFTFSVGFDGIVCLWCDDDVLLSDLYSVLCVDV